VAAIVDDGIDPRSNRDARQSVEYVTSGGIDVVERLSMADNRRARR